MTEKLPLDYTQEWLALGIVTLADIQRDQLECARGEDSHPEHYRWQAFSRFLLAHQQLAPLIVHRLYVLGDSDADPTLGTSMKDSVLRHPDCPLDLLHSALESEHEHLRRIAAQRLGQLNENPR